MKFVKRFCFIYIIIFLWSSCLQIGTDAFVFNAQERAGHGVPSILYLSRPCGVHRINW